MNDMFSPTLPDDIDLDDVLGNVDLLNDAHGFLTEEIDDEEDPPREKALQLADDYAVLRRTMLLLIVSDNLSRAKFEQAVSLAQGLK